MEQFPYLRLGVNIDHVATLRNARGGLHPDPVDAAHLAVKAGADGITAHLREDRRHISDNDILRLKTELNRPLNLEMATTPEMLKIATYHKPHACCLVPEKREELTTEGGLDVAANEPYLTDFVAQLKDNGIRVSMFIDPDEAQIQASRAINADIVELHVGTYCNSVNDGNKEEADKELKRLQQAATLAKSIGLEVHAGHGLTYDSVQTVAAIAELEELNIGHFLIGEAILNGLENAIRQMRNNMEYSRREAAKR